MSSNQLTNDLQEFIDKNISSIAQLELLFLFYLNPNRTWNNVELSNETRTNSSAVAKNISKLLSVGFILLRENEYVYNMKNQETHLRVRQLYHVYQERPVAVITFIYEKPKKVLQGFADAFKIKKD